VLANRSKGDFLAVMSHELRTPLTTIIGYADLMLGNIPTTVGERGKTYVQRVRTAADHLLALIDQILIYSRLEIGRLDTQPEQLSVSDVVREVVALMEPIAEERGLEFVVPETPAVLVETDLGKLRQILLNLVTNAIKFTEKGVVELTVEDEDEHVVFVVRDTGPGIEPAHIDSVFNPFWQVDQSSTRRAGGTGLGLTVSRRLARLLGGDVDVRSRVARGSTFRVRLPKRWQGRGADPEPIGEMAPVTEMTGT
jgi:signal transduction histidine kinase